MFISQLPEVGHKSGSVEVMMARAPCRVSKPGLFRYVYRRQRLGSMPVRRLRGDEGAVQLGAAREELPRDCWARRRGDCRRSGEASRRRSWGDRATATKMTRHGRRRSPRRRPLGAHAGALHFGQGELALDELAEVRGGFHGGRVCGAAARMGCRRSSKGCHGRRSGFVPRRRNFSGVVPSRYFTLRRIRPASAEVNDARGIPRFSHCGNGRR